MSIYSGSSYQGETKNGWYHGQGVFTYPSGVKYQGEFFKGEFHGQGTLIYQNGVKLAKSQGQFKGVWNMGKLTSGDYYFYDQLKFDEGENWDYCQGSDRRFNYERDNGIKPSGQTQLKNDPKGEEPIPPGTYDTGDGFYDPIRSLVFSYCGKNILRTPDAATVDWITRTCRYNPRTTKDPITGVNLSQNRLKMKSSPESWSSNKKGERKKRKERREVTKKMRKRKKKRKREKIRKKKLREMRRKRRRRRTVSRSKKSLLLTPIRVIKYSLGWDISF